MISVAPEHLSGLWEAEGALGPTNTPNAARKSQAGQSTLVLHYFFFCGDRDKQEKTFRALDPSKSG